VTYFKKWRVQELQKKARLKELEAQGAVKMDVNAQFTERR
jgi:cytochrome c oxidase assembly factor 6